jgi:hypothetical protein
MSVLIRQVTSVSSPVQVCIDTLVQRLGDAAAAGVYKMMEGLLLEGPSAVAISALPVCFTFLEDIKE